MRIGIKIILTVLLVLSATNINAWEWKDGNDELFKFNGQALYRGRYYNLDFNDDSEKGSLNRHNYFGDLSLQFTMKPEKNVTLFFELHKFVFEGQKYRYNSIQTGEEVMPEELEVMIGNEMVKLPIRVTNTDEAWEMHLRQAWMDINVPKYPFKFKLAPSSVHSRQRYIF